MSKSFYNYIVDDLLLNYFKKANDNSGCRYYVIVENDEYRQGLLDAITVVGEPIELKGIYQSSDSLEEESYHTCALSSGKNKAKIIVGNDKDATEDYLTTIRNIVGQKNTQYENYGVLYVLSDSSLSSLMTACQDLQSSGFPLSAEYIMADINKKIDVRITKEYERNYLSEHLKSISESISDGVCNLFDFQNALSILNEEKLQGHYVDINCFTDSVIYEDSFKAKPTEIAERIQDNGHYFQRINVIMNEESDREDKLTQLQKFLDEKLSKRILKAETDWKSLDFRDIQESVERKNATAKLALKGYKVVSSESNAAVISDVDNYIGDRRKKSTNYALVCDELWGNSVAVRVEFNKAISCKKLAENCNVNGKFLTLKLIDKPFNQSVGINENCHKLNFLHVPFSPTFMQCIGRNYTISKKGEIVISVPEDWDTLCLGTGNNQLQLSFDKTVKMTANDKLVINIGELESYDKYPFVVCYNGYNVKFILKLNVAKTILPIEPDKIKDNKEYKGVETPESSFGKIFCEGVEYSVVKHWRKYLEWEQLFVKEKAIALDVQTNSFDERNIEPQRYMLPEKVNAALNSLFVYFQHIDNVPSLVGMNPDLHNRYVEYWNAVKESVQQIPTNRSLTNEEYNLTRLGVVMEKDRLYLSPFHPIVVAYLLELDRQRDGQDETAIAHQLVNPFYLLPYLYFNSQPMRPYTDSSFMKIKRWLCYEPVDSKPQERTNNITTKMVWSKMLAFLGHFEYLFQDKDCPIKISTVGIVDDSNVIKGVVEFIKKEISKGVQRIELHEYVNDLMSESFFEKLNRLDSSAAIEEEFKKYDVCLEKKGEYTSQEVIHQLFTRVSFYKHSLDEAKGINYCHIVFYQMNSDNNYIEPNTDESRVELALGGLISSPSTRSKDGEYVLGYGTKGLKQDDGYIYPMATVMNNLYSNEKNHGGSQFHIHTCVAKQYRFDSQTFLDSIYDKANWVTFINPEVDIDFFYKNNLYVIHYTDQYSINAKYDSITVTKHVKLYENMLRKSYENYALAKESFDEFNHVMIHYFNCLNGSWMLDVVNKSEAQIREKMSIVAASVAMLRFMKRNKNICWIPVSLEEILRVTGSIGLQQDFVFSKKALGAKGTMSDDLLMIGLDASDKENLKLYLYPIEVKCSKNSSMADKGSEQVCHTYQQLRDHLYGEETFLKKIYKTFFASQLLTNAEKLNANQLLCNKEYEIIEECRYQLLNVQYELVDELPVKEMGHAAVVSFFAQASHDLHTHLVEDVNVCEVHFSEKECFQLVADPNNNHLEFLETDDIQVDAEVLDNKDVSNQEASVLVSMENVDEYDDSLLSVKPSTENIIYEGQLPFAADPVKKNGIQIKVGKVKGTGTEVIFEPNNTAVVSHPNMGIIGTMGTGKTQFARSLIAQFSKESSHNVGGRPVGMLVFDYKGDYKDKEFLDAVDGHAYKFNYPFNPLKLVENEDVAGMNLPAITADRISDSFAKAYGLGLKQQSNIKQVIIEAYADCGINKNPLTWKNQPPTMAMVIDKYFEQYDANDKAYALFDKLRDYTIFTTDNSNCVSLFEWLDSVRVIDLTLYPDDTKKVIVSLILDLFYAEMRQLGGSKQENGFRELRAMIMVDEAHQFLKKDFNSLRSIISEGRMFGVGMILSTQNVGDFKTSKEDYSQFILSWVIHHVNSISKSEIASIFGTGDNINSEGYMNFINKAKIFESVCKIGGLVEGIRDLPFFELVNQDERFKKNDN